jgi:hypothetical protein
MRARGKNRRALPRDIQSIESIRRQVDARAQVALHQA